MSESEFEVGLNTHDARVKDRRLFPRGEAHIVARRVCPCGQSAEVDGEGRPCFERGGHALCLDCFERSIPHQQIKGQIHE